MRRADLANLLNFIHNQKPDFKPEVALVLGSGLGELAEQIQQAVKIPFTAMAGFPHSSVVGHQKQLVLGYLSGVPVACMQGRMHSYEGTTAEQFKLFIRILYLLGCHTLILTNAAGSLRSDMPAGGLVLIRDHINLQSCHPLAGANDDEFGERFFALTDAYDPVLRQQMLKIAADLAIPLTEGIYLAVNGPYFETPAEIHAFRQLGADLVGMSTVPETLIARHCGMRVLAISSVTNLAAGMTAETLSHAGTLAVGKIAAVNLRHLINQFLATYDIS